MTKTGFTLARMESHVAVIPLSAEDYLKNEMSKANQTPTCNKCDQPVDQFTQLHKHKHSSAKEVQRKDTIADAHTKQQPRHADLEHGEAIRLKGNRIKDI